MTDPFRLPEDGWNRLIHFSGGRSSGYMLRRILDAHGGALPDTARVVFCNTGKEREETLGFVDRCATAWGVEIVWLEYDYRPDARGGRADPKYVHRRVSYTTASRNGEPFETLIRKASMLPNVAMRKCTAELKVETSRRYARRALGWPSHRDVLGIRHDEFRRWQKALMTECRTEYPMVLAGVTQREVMDFWCAQPFDLGIPSARGNCDLCFLKGLPNLLATLRAEPERADWWIAMEREAPRKLRRPENARFSKRWSYAELRDLARRTPELPMDDAPAIACYCGD